MLLSHPLEKAYNLLFQESEPRQDHVLARVTAVSQSVNSADEVDILCGSRVHTCGRVDSERARLSALDTFDIQLEHRGEFWPERHAHSIVVEVQNWDLVPLLHKLLELIV